MNTLNEEEKIALANTIQKKGTYYDIGNTKVNLEEIKNLRPPYVVPKNQLRIATMTRKLCKCCGFIAFHVPKDLIYAMGLEKGLMVHITIEIPELPKSQ